MEEGVARNDPLQHPCLKVEDPGMALVKYINGSHGLI